VKPLAAKTPYFWRRNLFREGETLLKSGILNPALNSLLSHAQTGDTAQYSNIILESA
jgi:hypothetical protein